MKKILDNTCPHDSDTNSQLFQKKIWNINDVSLATGYKVKTIYNMTSEKTRRTHGKIPSRKRGGRLFFFPEEILNWIEEGEN